MKAKRNNGVAPYTRRRPLVVATGRFTIRSVLVSFVPRFVAQVNVKAEKDFKLQEKEIATLKKKVRACRI